MLIHRYRRCDKLYQIFFQKNLLERHLDYFNRVVVPRMDQKSYDTILKRILKKGTKGNLNYKLNKMKNTAEYKAFSDLMRLCQKHKDKIAVGKREELLDILPLLDCKMDSFKSCNKLMNALKKVFDYNTFAESRQRVDSLLQNPGDVLDRDWCAYTFVIMLGLRVCPYCNEQYIAPTLCRNGRVRGDLDHFLPKERYPFFALSIYNLVPCCKFCNSSLKGTKTFNNTATVTPYEVSYDDCFIFEVRKDIDSQNWYIEMKMDTKLGNKFEELLNVFLLQERYQHHRDVVEDYMRKKVQYCSPLIQNIIKYYNHHSVISFLADYFGYPLEAKAINDNVLNKLKRDIAKYCLRLPGL